MTTDNEPSKSPLFAGLLLAREEQAPDVNRLLPLPAPLANTLPWRLSGNADGEGIELHELTSPELISRLDKGVATAYQEAIRAGLRRVLAEETLPAEILDSPVRLSEASEICAYLRRKGQGQMNGQEPLTIRRALPFIGRRVNRLLQCLEPTIDVPRTTFAAGDWVELTVNMKAASIGIIATRRMAERESAQRRVLNAPWLPMEPPKKWHNKREAAPSGVRITLDDGGEVSARDVRFGWALLRINGLMSLHGQSLAALTAEVTERQDSRLALSWRWLLQALARAQAMTVAEECAALMDALVPRADGAGFVSSILGPRYGLGGTETTLQAAGEAAGMTRERIRQLQASFEARIEQGEVYAPCLSQMVTLLESLRAASMESVSELLGGSLGDQSVAGALAFAASLGLVAKGRIFEVTVAGPGRLEAGGWTTKLTETQIPAILRSARSMTSRIGAFHLTAVTGDVADGTNSVVTSDEVKAVLDGCGQCVWLDDEIGWGTISGVGDFPVLVEVRRMLAIAYPLSLDITEIFAGLTQCRRQSLNRSPAAARFGGGMPPPWIVRKLLELQVDEFEVVQYDNFRLRKYINPMSLLEGDSEKRIFEGLRKLGGVASWRQLSNAMVATRLVNPITFAVYLKTCSYIYQPAYGIYAFRGQRMHIQAVWKDGQQYEFPLPVSGIAGGRAVTEHSDSVISFEVSQTSSGPGRHRAVYAPSRSAARTTGTFLSEIDPGLRIRIQPSGQIGRLADELEAAGVPPRGKIVLTLDLANRSYRWVPCEG
ncbi:MAG: hypothetical protein Q7K57_17990 [Burkholderiaceae bacterium]|nr:hypothetical protein [Polaromonas sp.]MDO8770554.1 hypothetical protein [Burkholderiaceae bacterium]